MSLDDNIIMAGFLDKTPPIKKTASVLKSSKRRWFVLKSNPAQFSYYADKDTRKQAKGHISMEDVVNIDLNKVWPFPKSRDKHPWVLTIESVSGRIYYLSAGSEEMMTRWAMKLKETFDDIIMKNKAPQRAGSMRGGDGLVTVNTQLVKANAPTISFTIDERTSSASLCLQACRRAEMSDAEEYTAVSVNPERTKCVPLHDITDSPLSYLRRFPEQQLFLIHKHEVVVALRLIHSLPDYEDAGISFQVRYLGAETSNVHDEEVEGETVSIETINKRIDAVKKAAPIDEPVTLKLSLDGIQVYRETSSPKRPTSLVIEDALFTVLDCFNIDKIFAYLVLINRGENSKRRLYVFKCADAKMATKIRLHTRGYCQSAFFSLPGAVDTISQRTPKYGEGFEFLEDANKASDSGISKKDVPALSEKEALGFLVEASGLGTEFTTMEALADTLLTA